MPELLVKPAAGAAVHDVTPASAGWSYIGFGLHDLAKGEMLSTAEQPMRSALSFCPVMPVLSAAF